MKQGIPSRRARGRGNTRGRQQSNIRNQQMDSNGPAGRLRGTPQQILDRYSALARDASSSGDMVLAENLWQHAEHYVRLLSAAQPQQQQQQPSSGSNGHRYGNGRDDDYDFDDQNEAGESGGARAGSQDAGASGSGNNGSANNGSGNNNSGNGPEQKGERDEAEREPAPEPLVLKANPEPVPPIDLGNSEQPDTPTVWSEADVRAATEEADAEQRPPPRRRRRTRFPRQTEGSAAADEADSASDNGPSLKLPEDPSPAALVDLLTRAEESTGERKPRTRNNSED